MVGTMKNKILFLLILCVQKVLFAAAGGGGSQPPVPTGWFSCFGGRCGVKSAKVSPAQESVEMLDDSPDEHGGGLKSPLYDPVEHRNMLRSRAIKLVESAGPFDYKSYLEAAYLFKNAGGSTGSV